MNPIEGQGSVPRGAAQLAVAFLYATAVAVGGPEALTPGGTAG